jgi:hypothetical protein
VTDHERLDRKIAELAASTKRDDEAPGLRSRIEAELIREMREKEPAVESAVVAHRRRSLPWIGAAAGIAAAVLLVFLLTPPRHREEERRWLVMDASDALTASAEESRLLEAIDRLAPLVARRMEEPGGGALRVRGQLAYLDANIETCREAGRANGLNRGVRQALLQSYRRKVELMEGFVSQGRDRGTERKPR